LNGRVLFTQDTHEGDYLETQEGVRLPVEHCIRGHKGLGGSSCDQSSARMPTSQVIEKPTFGSSELGRVSWERLNEEEPIVPSRLPGALHRYLPSSQMRCWSKRISRNSIAVDCDMLCGRYGRKSPKGAWAPCACVRSILV